MKNLFLFGLFLFLFSCNPPAPRVDDNIDTPTFDKKTATVHKKDCAFNGEVLTQNKYLLRDLKKFIVLSMSEDKPSGVLEVYNSLDCSLLKQIELPVNGSPNVPYYLAQIMYNKNSNVIGIRGLDKICLYNAQRDTLTPPLMPKYFSKRSSENEEANHILHVEVWENYLLGFAKENGAFIFNIEDITTPKSILPIAEIKKTDKEYSSLFLLPSNVNKQAYQAIFPQFNYDLNRFEIRSLFDEPKALKSKNVQLDNKYKTIILQGENEAYKVDMVKQKLL